MEDLVSKISTDVIENWKSRKFLLATEIAIVILEITDRVREVSKPTDKIDKRLSEVVQIFDNVLTALPSAHIPKYFDDAQSEIASAFALLFFISEEDFKDVVAVYASFLDSGGFIADHSSTLSVFWHATYIFNKTIGQKFFSTKYLVSILSFAIAVVKYYIKSLGEQKARLLAYCILEKVIEIKIQEKDKVFLKELFGSFIACHPETMDD